MFVIKGDTGSPGLKGIKGSAGSSVRHQFVNFLFFNPCNYLKRISSSTVGSHRFARCPWFTRIGRSQGDCFAFATVEIKLAATTRIRKTRGGFLKRIKPVLEA